MSTALLTQSVSSEERRLRDDWDDWDHRDDRDQGVTLGADPMALRRLAGQMSTAAAGVESSGSRVETELSRTWWQGRSADLFRGQWDSKHGPALQTVQRAIRAAGEELVIQAVQQEEASANWTRSAPLEVGPAGTAKIFAGVFAANRVELDRRLKVLRDAERVELIDREKWYRFVGTLLPSSQRLGAIRRAIAEHEGLTEDGRQFLLLGRRRVVEVFGDLDSATRIGIWVPGVGTTMSDFADSTALGANRIWDHDPDLAMIEWLGYEPPSTIPHAAVELGHGARTAGEDLNTFVSQLKGALAGDRGAGTVAVEGMTDAAQQGAGAPTITIGGHSYGAVVSAYAASLGTDAVRVVLAGSPGVPVPNVEEFRLGGVPGSVDNVAVVTNRFDPVSLGHLADDVITAAAPLALGPPPMGPLAQLIGRIRGHAGPLAWWSEMSHDPNTRQFGALLLPSDDTQASGAVTGSNHRYSEAGSTSLESLRAAFR